ncbi:MAG: ribosome modulation factor [Candidatus Berkiellales bacterium]
MVSKYSQHQHDQISPLKSNLINVILFSEVIMKRAKRSNSDRAFKLGYIQGSRGHSKDLCPFHTAAEKRDQWIGGWRVGHADYVAGFRTPTVM